MTNHRSKGGTESSPYPSDFYDCSTYTLAHQKRTHACCGHYIRTKAVRELVLNTIRTVSTFAISNQEEFAEKVRSASQIKQKEAAKEAKRKLNKDKKRIAELDNIIKSSTSPLPSDALPMNASILCLLNMKPSRKPCRYPWQKRNSGYLLLRKIPSVWNSLWSLPRNTPISPS